MTHDPLPAEPVLPPRAGAPPQPIRMAVMLMRAGAGLSLIQLLLTVVLLGSVRTRLRAERYHGAPLTASHVHTYLVAYVGSVAIVSLTAVALWLLMARLCGQGRSLGRILASVLFFLNTLITLLNVARPMLSAALVLTLLVWITGLLAVVFLWQRPSSDYFRAGPA